MSTPKLVTASLLNGNNALTFDSKGNEEVSEIQNFEEFKQVVENLD